MQQSLEKLAALRKAIALCGGKESTATVPLGFTCADAVLNGGLRCGSLNEVYASNTCYDASVTGFSFGFAARIAGNKPIFWIGTDFGVLENGALNATGLADLGLDPSRFFIVQLPRGEDVLRAAHDVLACPSVGAAVLEITGTLNRLDLSASRRLALSGKHHNVSVILLRTGSQPQPSAAETRWLIHAAASPPSDDGSDWGAPRFDVRLIRNRHGELGEWRVEWNCSDGFFVGTSDQREKTDTRRLVSAIADRQAAATVRRVS